jgi:REP-associated tyrosine transposase
MPRPPRRLPPQGTFHICNRGACRQDVFVTDEDRVYFLAELGRVAKEKGWIVLAVCLMGNHYHVIVETPLNNLVEGMHLLATRVAVRFNREHGRTGHVFESRFKSPPVETQEYFEYLLGYLALNPVEAGFCRHAEDWKWSSFGAVVRGEDTMVDTARLFARLADGGPDPRATYRRCLERAESVAR